MGFEFRFNRRKSSKPGLLLYRLMEYAVLTPTAELRGSEGVRAPQAQGQANPACRTSVLTSVAGPARCQTTLAQGARSGSAGDWRDEPL